MIVGTADDFACHDGLGTLCYSKGLMDKYIDLIGKVDEVTGLPYFARDIALDTTGETVGKIMFLRNGSTYDVQFRDDKGLLTGGSEDFINELVSNLTTLINGNENENIRQTANEQFELQSLALQKSIKEDILALKRPVSLALTQLWELEHSRGHTTKTTLLPLGGFLYTVIGNYLSCRLKILPMLDVNGDLCYYLSEMEYFFTKTGLNVGMFVDPNVAVKMMGLFQGLEEFDEDDLPLTAIMSHYLWNMQLFTREDSISSLLAKASKEEPKIK